MITLDDSLILERNFISCAEGKIFASIDTGRTIKLFRITDWVYENTFGFGGPSSHKMALAIDCTNNIYLIYRSGSASNNCWLFDEIGKDIVYYKYLLIEYKLYKRNKLLSDILHDRM